MNELYIEYRQLFPPLSSHTQSSFCNYSSSVFYASSNIPSQAALALQAAAIHLL